MDFKNVMVSMCICTYNHEKYIAQAIDSALMQKTDFNFEIVIGEDCSADGTLEIISSYKNIYPDIIRIITSGKNVGAQINAIRTLGACNGKYIAICDGDDYWTDPYKLQKQVDFLEVNKECVICHHNIEMISENTGKKKLYNNFDGDKIYNQNELLRKNTIATCSIIFRNLGIVKNLPAWSINCPIGDIVLTALLTQNGNIGYINEVMGVYRRRSGGIHGGKPRIQNYLDGIQSRLILGENTGLINNPNLRWSLSNLYRNASWEFEQSGHFSNAKKYAYKRLKYSQKDQISASIKRILVLYFRYYYRKTKLLLR